MLGFIFSALLAIAPPPSLEDSPPISTEHLGISGPLETQSIDTARFHLRYTPRAQGAARFLAGDIERLRDAVREVLGRDWPGVTEVRLGFGRDEYEGLAMPGGAPPSWAVALAYPASNVMLVEAHSLIQGDGQTTFRHELVHVALGQLGHGWPRWFQEGLAQDLTGERRFRVSQFALLAQAVSADRIIRFDDLANRFPDRADDVEVAYAQSAAFVRFLRDRHGARAFGQLIDFVSEGDNFEKAFGKAFHSPLSFEEQLFRDDLPHRYPWWTIILSGGSLIWALSSVLLVFAHVRRRQFVEALRAEQARIEVLEDSASWLLAATPFPANDDAGWLIYDEDAPWVVSSVTDTVTGSKTTR